MLKFSDCTLAEFTALCDQRDIRGIDREDWVRLFKRCANAPGKLKASHRQQRMIETFIKTERKLSEPSTPIAQPKPTQKRNR